MNDLIYFYPQGHENHFQPGHPERPERIEAYCQILKDYHLWDAYPKVSPVSIPETILTRIHTPQYLDYLKACCERGFMLDGDTYTTPASWQLANQSAGGGIAVAEMVWKGEAKKGFALTRPPGHHATRDQGMGFCLLNNIALASEVLLQENAMRLAIVDVDLHHGNGTQDIFWRRNDVFYISTHQSPLYPGTGELTEIGAGEGKGFTANFPLPPASGDQAFLEVLNQLILPLLTRVSPEMILVSAGFDPHYLDPLGSLRLSATGYNRIISGLSSWAERNCSGRIALFLEGGYDLQAGAACALASVTALLDLPFEDPLGPSPRPEGTSWRSIVQNAREIWQL